MTTTAAGLFLNKDWKVTRLLRFSAFLFFIQWLGQWQGARGGGQQRRKKDGRKYSSVSASIFHNSVFPSPVPASPLSGIWRPCTEKEEVITSMKGAGVCSSHALSMQPLSKSHAW